MESGQPEGNSSRMQMTKAVLFASCFCMLLVFGSCTGQQAPVVDDTRVTELQNKVAALEKKVEDLQLKGQIVSSVLFKLSEQKFLNSSRFWSEVYDSAHANCARDRIEDTRIARDACAEEADENERLRCFEDVSVQAARRQSFCGGLQ